MSHPGHEIVKCSQCGTIIRQCRCPAHDKPVRYEYCGCNAPLPDADAGLMDSGTCPHESFEANVEVNRLEDIGRFTADVRVKCAMCGIPMRFIGLPAGLDLNGATVSADATEARLAIAPKDEVIPVIESDKPTGFSVRRES